MTDHVVAISTPLPGYNQLEIEQHFLWKTYFIFDQSQSLVDRLTNLKNDVAHIDALVISISEKCDRETILALSTLYPQCKLIANYGVGFNHIDILAASEAKISVTNTPGVLAAATADIALALLLMTTRRLYEGAKLLQTQGRYPGWKPDYHLGISLQSKTIGIVGLGSIGREFAKRVQALGCKVVALQSSRSNQTDLPDPIERLSEDEFFACIDVLSFHCQLTQETLGWYDAKRIEKCKRGIVVINTSRGEVINEKDLRSALENGQIFAVGLDVFCHEPVLSEFLKDAPNTIILPHLGSATFETRKDMSDLVLENIASYFAQKPLPNLVSKF